MPSDPSGRLFSSMPIINDPEAVGRFSQHARLCRCLCPGVRACVVSRTYTWRAHRCSARGRQSVGEFAGHRSNEQCAISLCRRRGRLFYEPCSSRARRVRLPAIFSACLPRTDVCACVFRVKGTIQDRDRYKTRRLGTPGEKEWRRFAAVFMYCCAIDRWR